MSGETASLKHRPSDQEVHATMHESMPYLTEIDHDRQLTIVSARQLLANGRRHTLQYTPAAAAKPVQGMREAAPYIHNTTVERNDARADPTNGNNNIVATQLLNPVRAWVWNLRWTRQQ